jgi:hypothetical protein
METHAEIGIDVFTGSEINQRAGLMDTGGKYLDGR